MDAVTGATTLEVSARRAGPSKAARDALLRAFSGGDHDAAIASAREIVAAYPGAALAWKILAASLGTVGTLAADTAHRGHGHHPVHPGIMQRPEVGAVVDLMRGDGVTVAVAS